MSKPTKTLPVLFDLRSSSRFIVFCISTAVFTDTFLYGLVIPIFPYSLSGRAGIPEDQIQKWNSILLGLFGIGSVISSLFFGWLADRMSGRQTPLLLGLTLFLAATVLLWLSQSIVLLCLGRFFQGVSTAVVWTVGLALLVDSVGPSEIAVQTGYTAAALSVGFVAGPLVGGIVYDKLGYDAVFIIAIALLVVDILLRVSIIEKRAARTILAEHGLEDDVRRPLLPREVADSRSTQDTPVVQASPMLALFKSVRINASLISTLIQGITVTALEATLTVHVKSTFNYTPTQASLVFLSFVIPSLFAPLIGKLCDYVDKRYIVSGSFILGGIAYTLMQIPTDNSKASQVFLIILLVLSGLAFPSTLTPIVAEIFETVEGIEKSKPGIFGPMGGSAQGYGLFNGAYALGTIIGPLAGGFIKYKISWGAMSIFLGIISFIASFPALLFIGGRLSIGKLLSRESSASRHASP
ncbi:MAG: hypothetical protein M1814_006873 [Vezdaea aestivalis]|nr:MAG: hypothetical protein M1814_006873 [Vezdaea aestivalis]